jgi:hypothetical protein
MEPERAYLQPVDLRTAAQVCLAILRSVESSDWDVRAGCLTWDARETLDHIVDCLGCYAVQLAGRATAHVPFYTRSIVWRETAPAPVELLAALEVLAATLADVVTAAPSDVRAYHPWGFADPIGFVAMGCAEMLIHTEDILQGFKLSLDPPRDLCGRIVRRLFPWAPEGVDAWSALQWSTGRIALPQAERLASDWAWHSAPLQEWDGTVAGLASHASP